MQNIYNTIYQRGIHYCLKRCVCIYLLFFNINYTQAQEKNKYMLKIYPLSLFTNARLGLEIPLGKRVGVVATTSYYYENPNKGGGRSKGFMGQLFVNYHIVNMERKYPLRLYMGAGYSNISTGFTYKYERWDYDKANGRELSYVPFVTTFGGKFTAVQVNKTSGLYGEVGLMGSIPLYDYKHISLGWQFGYRFNPVPTSLKNIYTENHDQFDYKWYKLHFAYSPSLNTYYNSFGIGSGIKINISVNYIF